MNEALLENHNATVKPQDTIFFGGDFGFNMSAEDIQSFAKKMNGNKTIILGNHDRSELFKNFPGRVVYRILELRGKDWMPYMPTICHYPMESWNGSYHGSIQLHGHIHSKNPTDGKTRRYDIGVDANNFTPVSLDHITSTLSKIKTPKELDAINSSEGRSDRGRDY